MRHDHDRTVAAARENMALTDQRKPLERWIQNYAGPAVVIPEGQWCVVTKAKDGWKIELGVAEATTPYMTLQADAHAPQPPVLEIRPPKPEPVKPRWRNRDRLDVPSFEQMLGRDMVTQAERQIVNALATDETANAIASKKGFSIEDLLAAIALLPEDLRRQNRPYYRMAIKMKLSLPFARQSHDAQSPIRHNNVVTLSVAEIAALEHAHRKATLDFRYAMLSAQPLRLSDRAAFGVIGIDGPPAAPKADPSKVDRLNRPPPAPTKRNQ